MAKTKAAKKGYLKQEGIHTPRRPKRPVDRQKMLDWLLEKLKRGQMEKSLEWLEPGKVFKVRWPHASRKTYKVGEADLFKAWAMHTELYKDGDPDPDHRKWKANFRCAIHSLPDLEEITTEEQRKAPNRCRVFRIRDKPLDKKRKTSSRSQTVSPDEEKGEDSDSTEESHWQGDLPSTVNEMIFLPKTEQKNIPDKIEMGIIQPMHFSGGCCIIKNEDPPACTLPIITPSPTIINTSPSPLITTTPFITTTTTSPTPFQPFSFPTPSPSHSPSPPLSSSFPPCLSEMADETLEGMIPVGVMISRQGGLHSSPSADMVLPASPPQEPQCQHLQVQEVLEVTEEELQSIIAQGFDLGAIETVDMDMEVV